MRRLARVAAVGLGTGVATALGAWTSACVIAVHSVTWGLILGLLATGAAVLAASPGLARLGFTLGWGFVLLLAVLGRPEGDWVIEADVNGYALLGCGLAALASGVATLPVRPRAASPVRAPT